MTKATSPYFRYFSGLKVLGAMLMPDWRIRIVSMSHAFYGQFPVKGHPPEGRVLDFTGHQYLKSRFFSVLFHNGGCDGKLAIVVLRLGGQTTAHFPVAATALLRALGCFVKPAVKKAPILLKTFEIRSVARMIHSFVSFSKASS